ncbi:hypothetical protein HDU76_008864 [Blyttiomyces sp. JEL0837]|nr:hypothetical protein HDU76_008864 [Blyttiomyces sp. JEL0837]
MDCIPEANSSFAEISAINQVMPSVANSDRTSYKINVNPSRTSSKPGIRTQRSVDFTRTNTGTSNASTNAVMNQLKTGMQNAILVAKRSLGSATPSHFLESLLAVPRNWFTLQFKDPVLERKFQTYLNEVRELRQARLYGVTSAGRGRN